jgi:S1-C subfamily serine protease
MLKNLILLLLGLSGLTANVIDPLSTTTVTLSHSTTTKNIEFVTETKPENVVLATSTVKASQKKLLKSSDQNKPKKVTELITKPKSETLPSPEKPVDFKKINEDIRPAIVNIICTSKSGGYFDPISASGVMIDPRGIILTNAHVAQYIILQDENGKNLLDCIARTGSPATASFKIETAYISPFWVTQNYKGVGSFKQTETGENDFALLKITGNTSDQVLLKPPYKYIQLSSDTRDLKKDSQVIVAGYPAEFLDGIFTQRELYLASSVVKVGERFTFRSGSLDIFELGGSPLAQQGSSGGAVVDSNEKLKGVVVTTTFSPETNGRNLKAISIAHINNSLFQNSGTTLDQLLKSDVEIFSQEFYKQVMPDLRSLLLKELRSKQ